MWCGCEGHHPFVDHRLSCLAHNNYAAVKDLFEICIALSAPKGLAGIRSASYQQRQPWFKSFAAPPRHSKRQTFGKGASYKWRPEDFLQMFEKHFETNGWNCVDFWLFLNDLSTFWTTLRYLPSYGLERWELPYNFLERRAASYSWLVVGGFWFASSLPPSFRTMHSTVCSKTNQEKQYFIHKCQTIANIWPKKLESAKKG